MVNLKTNVGLEYFRFSTQWIELLDISVSLSFHLALESKDKMHDLTVNFHILEGTDTVDLSWRPSSEVWCYADANTCYLNYMNIL